jgi:hypothetical protein
LRPDDDAAQEEPRRRALALHGDELLLVGVELLELEREVALALRDRSRAG